MDTLETLYEKAPETFLRALDVCHALTAAGYEPSTTIRTVRAGYVSCATHSAGTTTATHARPRNSLKRVGLMVRTYYVWSVVKGFAPRHASAEEGR